MGETDRQWITWEPIPHGNFFVFGTLRCSLCGALVVGSPEDLLVHEVFHERVDLIALKAGLLDRETLDGRRHARDRAVQRSPMGLDF